MTRKNNARPNDGRLHGVVLQLANLAKREHYGCEDSWYSCPKHPDGCSCDNAGKECTCGADEHNAKVNELLAELLQNSAIDIKRPPIARTTEKKDN